MENNNSTSISGITTDLQSINLGAKPVTAPNVIFSFESDKKLKTVSDSAPSLSKYFDQSTAQISNSDSVTFFNDLTASKAGDTGMKLGKDEPIVCRIFAETPVQAKPMDPTTSFFDLIGNKASGINSSGIVADVGLGHRDITDVRMNLCSVKC